VLSFFWPFKFSLNRSLKLNSFKPLTWITLATLLIKKPKTTKAPIHASTVTMACLLCFTFSFMSKPVRRRLPLNSISCKQPLQPSVPLIVNTMKGLKRNLKNNLWEFRKSTFGAVCPNWSATTYLDARDDVAPAATAIQ
jgi:hypothetical protein